MPLGSNDWALEPKRKMKSNSVVFRVCVKCGKEFRAKNARYNYCPSCYSENYSSRERAPEKCLICGAEFIPKTKHSKLCGKKECDHTFSRQKAQQVIAEKNRLMFSKGRVWLLDIEKWRWIREERGQENAEVHYVRC